MISLQIKLTKLLEPVWIDQTLHRFDVIVAQKEIGHLAVTGIIYYFIKIFNLK